MEINVASAIEELLDRRETVTIVGVGSLRLENLSAKITEDGKLISPPKAKLGFFDVQTNNEPLRKYLSFHYSIKKKDADKAIKKYSQSVINSLANYGEVKLQGIAKIKSKNGKYKVKAIDSFKSKYYEGLPTLPLSELKGKSKSKAKSDPVSTAKKELEKLPSEKKTPSTINKTELSSTVKDNASSPNPKPMAKVSSQSETAKIKETVAKVSPSKAVKSAVAVTSAVKATPISKKVVEAKKVATPITSKDSTLSLNDKLALQNSGQSNKPLVTPPSTTGNTKTPSSVNTKPQTPYVPVPPKKEKFGCLGPFLGLLGLLLLCFLVWKGLSCILNKNKTKIPATEKVVDAIKDGVDKSVEKVTEVSNEVGEQLEETGEKISEELNVTGTTSSGITETCIIIIGSFSNYQNVNRAERQLQDKGYDIYVEEYGPYTRVGFEFDCKGKDLPTYLTKIRRNLESRAWYLKPDLYVEYE